MLISGSVGMMDMCGVGVWRVMGQFWSTTIADAVIQILGVLFLQESAYHYVFL